MTHFIDPDRGEKKPIDLFRFLISGEYDQGDTALVSYDDVWDMIFRDEDREEMKARYKAAYAPPTSQNEDL